MHSSSPNLRISGASDVPAGPSESTFHGIHRQGCGGQVRCSARGAGDTEREQVDSLMKTAHRDRVEHVAPMML
ncbi:hypothetical protein Pd630_LPD04445 [Rhodococcus opacus PD630]|nr:hypothetical protein Pd630_LPD04445 [Rhodococcus opacus PD630]